jgi:Flp pilus assembly protein protease CpaA
MTAALVCGFFFLGATLATGTLFEIDGHPAALVAGGAFVLACLALRGANARALIAGRETPVWRARAIGLGVLACLPTALGLIVSRNQ